MVDGTPSPLKSQARISRYFRSSGIDTSSLPAIKDGVSVERNKLFCEWVRECVVRWVSLDSNFVSHYFLMTFCSVGTTRIAWYSGGESKR